MLMKQKTVDQFTEFSPKSRKVIKRKDNNVIEKPEEIKQYKWNITEVMKFIREEETWEDQEMKGNQ